MSTAVAAFALLALIMLITREFGPDLQSQRPGSLLALVMASMVTGAGITLFVWIVSTATRQKRGAISDGMAGQSFYAPVAGRGTYSESEVSLFRSLTNSGYWTQSPDGVFRQIEPATDDSQIRLRELLGKSRRIMAADEASIDTVNRLEQATAARKPYRDIVWRCRLPSGQIVSVRESGTPRFSPQGQFLGYHGLIEDISANVVDPLRSQLTLQTLNALPSPLALVHGSTDRSGQTDWQVAWANPPMAALSGRSLTELGEMKIHHWLLCAPAPRTDTRAGFPAERNRTGPMLSHILAQQTSHRGDGLVIDRYGSRRAVHLTIERIDATLPGDRLFLICADPNAAALKNMESRIAEVNRGQAQVARRSLEIDITARELETFSHTVSHDLRHPLRIVDGFARILQEDYGQLFDRTGNEHLNRILSASNRMTTMIDALIDLHGISSQPIAEDPVDLSALAHSIVEDLRSTEPERSVTVTIAPDLSCRGDRVLLRMALFNLIENAWKYTSRTKNAVIVVDAVSLLESRVFRVTDNGAGFDKRFADKLFTLFHRLHSQTDFKGSGIGLATVQRIIRRHGGRVWAESTPDKGACFQFTLWDDASDVLEALNEQPGQNA